MNRRALLRGAATVVFVGAALAFLAITVARDWQRVRAYDWDLRLTQLALSTLMLAAVLAWGVFVWSRVLVHFGHPAVAVRELLRVWFVSNLARYIPGKIWQFVGAVQLARDSGLPPAVLLSSMLLHVGFSLLAAAIVGAASLPFLDVDAGTPLRALAVAVPLLSLLLVHPAVFNFALRLVPRALHRDVLAWSGSWLDGLRLLLLSVFSWVAYGLAFYLFVASLIPLPASAIPALSGINALGFLAGYFAFFAPAGLGFREGAIALLLDSVATAGVAAVVAVLSRLWIIAAELLGAGLFWRRRG